MPEYVARITATSFPTWQSKPGAKVVLFSKKTDPPASLKALSTKYRQRLSFGFVSDDDAALASTFNVTSRPALFVVESGKAVGEDGYVPLKYEKESTKVTQIEFFIMDHAAAKPSEPSSGEGASKPKKKKTSVKESSGKSKSKSGSTDKDNSSGDTKSKSGDKKSKSKGGGLKETSARAEKRKAREKQKKKKAKDARKATRGKTVKNMRKLPQPENPITLKDTDLSKLTVKELRGILARYDEPCNGCIEKDNFLMKIASNRKRYGDMEHVAQAYKKKKGSSSKRGKRASKKKVAESSPSPSPSRGGDSDEGGGYDNDDPLCAAMLELETRPLHEEIAALKKKNAELQEELDNMDLELIHEDL